MWWESGNPRAVATEETTPFFGAIDRLSMYYVGPCRARAARSRSTLHSAIVTQTLHHIFVPSSIHAVSVAVMVSFLSSIFPSEGSRGLML